eukprot:3497338-Pyramimonas_sp.AAC.1
MRSVSQLCVRSTRTSPRPLWGLGCFPRQLVNLSALLPHATAKSCSFGPMRSGWGRPNVANLQQALGGAFAELEQRRFTWGWVRSPAHVYIMSLRELGWHALNARSIGMEDGRELDLLAPAPVQ